MLDIIMQQVDNEAPHRTLLPKTKQYSLQSDVTHSAVTPLVTMLVTPWKTPTLGTVSVGDPQVEWWSEASKPTTLTSSVKCLP